MKIKIAKLGRIAFAEAKSLSEMYFKRLKTNVPVEALDVKEEALLKKLPASAFVVVLDERGKVLSSVDLAKKIETWRDNPAVKELYFIVGGSYGVSDEMRKRANFLWSFSPLTFAGDVAWIVLWEQLYRAFSILNKTPYHHE